jgi:hypothetical protein
MMCVLTIPAGTSAPAGDAELAVDKPTTAAVVADARRDSDAAMEDCATAKPATMTDVEKYILSDGLYVGKITNMCGSWEVKGRRRLAL